MCIEVMRDLVIEVGALGRFVFPRGYYIYVGSAMNGLEARVQRHLKTSLGSVTAVHWHIDYLLKETGVQINRIYVLTTDDRMECVIATAISKINKSIKGFGCSDCRCDSHLFNVDNCDFISELGLKILNISDL